MRRRGTRHILEINWTSPLLVLNIQMLKKQQQPKTLGSLYSRKWSEPKWIVVAPRGRQPLFGGASHRRLAKVRLGCWVSWVKTL